MPSSQSPSDGGTGARATSNTPASIAILPPLYPCSRVTQSLRTLSSHSAMSFLEKVPRWIGNSRASHDTTRYKTQLLYRHIWPSSQTTGSSRLSKGTSRSIFTLAWTQSAGLLIGGLLGQQPGCRRIARFSAKRAAGKDEFERVDGLTSLGVRRLKERFVGTADVVISRHEAKQMIKNGDNIEGFKTEPGFEFQTCKR